MVGLGLIVFSNGANGQDIDLGSAGNFAIISAQGVTNDGYTVVDGNIALSPTPTITGFTFSDPAGLGIVTGTVHYADAVAYDAREDALAAYYTLDGLGFDEDLTGSNLGGITLTSGVYHFDSSAFLTGILTLDAGGDENAVFVFQIGSTLVTAVGSSVIVINSGDNITSNIFWQVTTSATFNTGTSFIGNTLALESVTFGTGASVTNGVTVALTGSVTLLGNAISSSDPSVAATGRYWNGANGNEWSKFNWSSTAEGTDELELGTNPDVIFSINSNPQNQNTILDEDFTISSLTVNDTAAVTIDGTKTLTISASGLITGININSGAGLVTIGSNLKLGYLSEVITVNNDDGVLITGVISGINGLTKAGTGVLTLTGVETYTGVTLVSEGTLQIGDGNTAGSSIASSTSVIVAPDGILAINLADGEIFGNSVTDNGLIQWIAQGTNIQAPTSVFSGTGSMLVTAPGTTILLGNNTFSGGTTIDTVGDVYVGNLLVDTSAPFGTGVLTINNGTIDTYESQLLHIDVGGYIQTGGEIAMHLEGTTPGSYTQYDVSGTADLSGGTVFVYDLSGNYVPYGGDSQNIIRTTGGLEGGFASNYPESHFYNAAFDTNFYYHQGDTLLYPTITYDQNNAYVTWVQDSFRSVPGLTPNQDAVGGGLDGYADQNAGLPDDVVAYLNGQNINDLPAMYDLIAPDELTAIYQMGFTAAEIQNANIQRHLQRVRQGSSAPAQYTREAESTGSKGGMGGKGGMSVVQETVMSQETNRWSVFLEGTGGSASVDSSSNASGYGFDTMGVTLGADLRVSDRFVVGILGAYGKSDAGFVNGGGIDAESYKAAVYATVYKDGFYVDALLGAGLNSYETKRSSLLGYAEGGPDGWEFNAMINTGYDIRRGNWTFGPTASVSYTRVMLDGFTETGSLTPLSYPDQHQESLRTELGARIAYNAVFNGMTITPQVRIAWQHEFRDSTQSMDSSFTGGSSPTFSVNGPHMDRDRAVISAGISAQITPTVCVYGFYDGQIGSSNYTSNQFSAGVKIDF